MNFFAETKKEDVTILFFIILFSCFYYSAGVSVVAAGISAAGALGSTFSICVLTSLFGVPSLEAFGRVMLEIRQSATNTAAKDQVPFSRKSVV